MRLKCLFHDNDNVVSYFFIQVAILLFVLLLWVGAISLFYHQWGKIRGLDDYQPDYVHANLTIHHNPLPDELSEVAVSAQVFSSRLDILNRFKR